MSTLLNECRRFQVRCCKKRQESAFNLMCTIPVNQNAHMRHFLVKSNLLYEMRYVLAVGVLCCPMYLVR